MSRVAEKALVRAPLASAGRFVAAFVAANTAPEGNGARVVLHVGSFSEPAIVSLIPTHQLGDMEPRFSVQWQAESAGTFPVFSGELNVEADEDYDAFVLALNGSYEPPGGIAGKVFDAIVGERLAAETTINLLGAVRDYVETLFQNEERHKHHTQMTGA